MLLLAIEFALSTLAVILAFVAPHLGSRGFFAVERRIRNFAARRHLATFTILFLALVGRLAVLPIEPIPHPGVHDEYSHLLLADTLVHGRLANPTPPMWVHFETFHENFTPVYGSIYYPGQGIVLALGQILLGHPFWGVWLSTGIMCAAICWALQAWLPPGWAFFGGVLAIIRLGTFSYWANSYWGGSVAALGGALVIGGMRRIIEFQRTRDALVTALGFAILANTRPFESVFFCIPIAIALCYFLLFKVHRRDQQVRKILAPMATVLTITLCVMGLYFYKTTGNALKLPYQLNMQRYGYAFFPWTQFNTSICFDHEVMAKLYQSYYVTYQQWRSQALTVNILRILNLWSFFLGSAMSIPLWFVPFAAPHTTAPKQWDRLIEVVVCFSLLGLYLPSVYLLPHYAAPLTCAGYVLYLTFVVQVFHWSPWGRPVGKALVRAVVIVSITVAAIYVIASTARPPASWSIPTWFSHWQPLDRAPIERLIRDSGGQHLVIVRYGPNHNPAVEWVFNGADIDHSAIIWARDMGTQKNRELIDYYKDRKIWLLEPDYSPVRLLPYSNGVDASSAQVMSP